MVIDLIQEMVALSVINGLISVVTKFSAIAKIRRYRRFHEGHHFIPMGMEVHGTPERDKDHFVKECAHLFHNR
jgi:hypothetical protein